MIRHAITVSELRLFHAPDPAPMADYDACCLLVWETPAIVWIRLLKGWLSQRMLRELLQWLVDQHIEAVRAHRSNRHVLPMAVMQPDGSYTTSVPELACRFLRPDATSDRAPL